MNRLPSLPTSVAIVSDGTDVFLSFHFEHETFEDAQALQRPLTLWLQLFLEMQGVVAMKVDLESLDGA